MAETSAETLTKVIWFVWENQQDLESEKNNYLSNIQEGINAGSIDTVRRAVEWLERHKLAKTWKEGNKKMVRLTFNPERGSNEE